jgi:hypothetical protein
MVMKQEVSQQKAGSAGGIAEHKHRGGNTFTDLPILLYLPRKRPVLPCVLS